MEVGRGLLYTLCNYGNPASLLFCLYMWLTRCSSPTYGKTISLTAKGRD